MKKFLLTVLLMSYVSMSANAFEWSNLNIFKNILSSNSNTVVTNTNNSLQVLDDKISNTNKMVQNSFIELVYLLSSTKEAKSIQSKIAGIMNNVTKTESEKSSLVAQIISSYAATLMNKKSDILSTIKNMSQKEQQNLNNVLIALVKYGAQYLTLAKDYAKTASVATKASTTIQNAANTISNAKQTVEALKDNADAVTSLAKSLTSLLNQTTN